MEMEHIARYLVYTAVAIALCLVAFFVLWPVWRWIPKRERGKKTEEKDTPEKSETSVTITTKEKKKVSTKKKVMAWAVVILLCLAFLPQLVGAGKWALAWIVSGPDQLFRGTPRSEWGVLSTPTTSAEESEFRAVVDPSELRLDHFVDGPRDWGWQTLPTEVEVNIPLDGKPHYSGLNFSLLGGSKLRIDCPGHNYNDYFRLYAQGDQQNWKIIGESDTFPLVETGRASGALFLKGTRKSMCKATNATVRAEVATLPGHTRIATWKVANGGESLQWGRLLDPGTLPWNLYVRFADEDGITLSPSVMQQYPARIHVCRVLKLEDPPKDAPSTKLISIMEKVISEPERVFGDYIVQEEKPFLAITPPDIPGKKVRIEVILDIEH